MIPGILNLTEIRKSFLRENQTIRNYLPMASSESSIAQGVSNLVTNYFIPPIISGLASKGVQVTKEEMSGWLRMPASTSSSSSFPSLSLVTPASQIPLPGVSTLPSSLVAYGGNAVAANVIASTTKKAKGKSKTPNSVAPDHERCCYMITRGANKDQRCPNPRKPGSFFCDDDDTKPTAKKQMEKGITKEIAGRSGGMTATMPAQTTTPQIDISSLPNLTTTNPLMAQLNASLTSTPVSKVSKLKVRQLLNGLFYEEEQGLVLKPSDKANSYVCVGMMNSVTDNVVFSLTPEKIDWCHRYDISYVDPHKKDIPQPSPAVSGAILPSVSQALPSYISAAGGSPGSLTLAVTDVDAPGEPQEDDDDGDDDDKD